MKYIKSSSKLIAFSIMFIMIFRMSIPVHASETWRIISGNTVVFEGTYEECQTYYDYVSYFTQKGTSRRPNGTVFGLTYSFLSGKIKFNFETNQMTWIDGSKWDITYTGSLDYEILSPIIYGFTDDAIRTFCPEFAETHSLIPDGVPDNFSDVLEKAKMQRNERNSKNENKIASEEQSETLIESFSSFDEVDYAERYPDVKNAFGTDKMALWNHYQTFGKQEGRTASFK